MHTLFVSVFHHDKNVEFTRKKESNSMMISQIVSSQIKFKVVKSLLENPLYVDNFITQKEKINNNEIVWLQVTDKKCLHKNLTVEVISTIYDKNGWLYFSKYPG